MSSAPEPLSKILIQYILAGGPAWTPLIGYLLILYGYLVSDVENGSISSSLSSSSKSRKKSKCLVEMDCLSDQISTLWTILCCLALSGIANVFIESCVSAVNRFDPLQNFVGMMGFGAVFSIIEEGCLMLYFIVKLIAAIENHGLRTGMKAFLCLCFASYAAGRCWETTLKIQYNLIEVSSVNQVNLPSLKNSVMLFSVSYLLLNAGLMALLVQACRPSIQKKTVKKTVKSSVFSRLCLVPLVNMLMPLAFILSYVIYYNGQVLGEAMQNILQILSSLQCAIPIILVFDMMSTEDAAITDVINSQVDLLEEGSTGGGGGEEKGSTLGFQTIDRDFQTFESFRASSQMSLSGEDIIHSSTALAKATLSFSSHRNSYTVEESKDDHGMIVEQEKRESIPAWRLTLETSTFEFDPLASPLELEDPRALASPLELTQQMLKPSEETLTK
jgi:hypothetical protein